MKPLLRNIILISSLSTFIDGYNLLVITPVLRTPGFFATNAITLSITASSAIIGNFLGALLLGNLSDRLGRKYMFLWDIVFFIIFGIVGIFSTSLLMLVVSRFFLGIGIGGDYPISSTMVSEFSPQSGRGRNVALLGFGWTMGFAVSMIFGVLLSSYGAQSWRYMLVPPVIFSAVVIIMRNSFYESEIWKSVVKGKKSAGKIRALFSPALIRATMFIAGFWFLFDVVQYGILVYAPSVMAGLGFTGHEQPVYASLFIAVAELIGVSAGIYLIGTIGRKTLLIAGFVGISIAMFMAVFHYSALFSILVIMLFGISAGIGPGIMEFVLPPENFPAEVRGTGAGFGNTMSRLGAAVGVLIQPIIIAAYGTSPVFIGYSFVAIIAIVVVAKLGTETAHSELPSTVIN